MTEIVGVQGPPPRNLLKPALILVVVVLLGILGVHLWTSHALDTRVAGLEERIAEQRRRDAAPRPVLWGEPVPGNAAEDYLRAEALASNLNVVRLSAPLKASRAGGALEPVDQELLDGYSEVASLVRSGLRKTHCDWKRNHELGLVGPDLYLPIELAYLLRLDSYRSTDSEEALQIAFDAFALGRDYERARVSVSATLRANGCRSLLSAMRLRALTAAQYRRIVDVLASIGPLDVKAYVEGMWRDTEVWLAALSGRHLTPGYEKAQSVLIKSYLLKPGASPDAAAVIHWNSSFDEATRKGLDDFVSLALTPEIESEWSASERLRSPALDLLTVPYPKRKGEIERLLKEAEGHVVAEILIKRVALAHTYADNRVLEDGTRVLAAAHLHRLETGAFPSGLQPLEEKLGVLPLDPYREGAPLSVALQNGVLRVYSWHEDGKDGGGPLPDPGDFVKGGDLTVSTSAP